MEFQNVTQEIGDMHFKFLDYTFFWLLLILSTAIGIYFGFIKKQSTAEDYLLGGKEMSVIPIALSLITSNISAIAFQAVPTDIYQYGIGFWINTLSVSTCLIISYYCFMPVFYELQVPSTYEYLKMRFNDRIRLLSSFLYTISMILFLPIVIYLPAIAISQGTGINIHFVTPLMCGVCIFYTTIGGLKAVVWTDTLQFLVMICALVLVTYKGLESSAGFTDIWNTVKNSGRLDFDFSLDITKRDPFIPVYIAVTLNWINYAGVGQSTVQKCLALPHLKDVKKAFIIFAFGMMGIFCTTTFLGFMIYNRYKDCDPISSGLVEKPDQIVPYYIINVASSMPGLPGLFISGIFSASLSTLSGSLNCLSCTIYKDFVSHVTKGNLSPETESNILKSIVVIVGAICTAFVYVVSQLGNVVPLVGNFLGVTTGPLLGLFMMGLLIPRANSKGAFYGCISSLLLMAWIIGNSQWYQFNHYINYPKKPLSVENCTHAFNITAPILPPDDTIPWFMYRITFYLYPLVGMFFTMIIGIVVSYLTKPDETPVDKKLICKFMHWAIPEDKKLKDITSNYYSLDKAIKIINDNSDNKYKEG